MQWNTIASDHNYTFLWHRLALIVRAIMTVEIKKILNGNYSHFPMVLVIFILHNSIWVIIKRSLDVKHTVKEKQKKAQKKEQPALCVLLRMLIVQHVCRVRMSRDHRQRSGHRAVTREWATLMISHDTIIAH